MKLRELGAVSNKLPETVLDLEFDSFGSVDSSVPKTISYARNEEFLGMAVENPNLCAIVCREGEYTGDRFIAIENENPESFFFELHDKWARTITNRYSKTRIAASSTIAKSAIIADRGVAIGANTVIGDHVVIHEGVRIGQDCRIESGTVIGADGFEVRRISEELCVVRHDGQVIIGDKVEIKPLCTIDKGLLGVNTVISSSVKIDSHVQVSHRVHVGKETRIAAHTMISGSVSIGESVWIGPGVTVSNGISIGRDSRISLGSVVIGNVKEGSRVTGYFAEDHTSYLRRQVLLKRALKRN